MSTQKHHVAITRPSYAVASPPADPALRDDDALSRAASDIAAPRRRLLAALRDAHVETCLRIAAFRRCDALLPDPDTPLRAVLARLVSEAEEHLRRLEIVFAWLRERPGAGLGPAAELDLTAILTRSGPERDGALLLALLAMERNGVEETRRLRQLAWMAGQNLAARLLDLTAAERDGAARALEAIVTQHGAGAGQPHH
jgi:hypothetical protein